MRRQAVHPHAGGENGEVAESDQALSGSPPRGWGKLSVAHGILSIPRFTPTRVGKTYFSSGARMSRSVHPHAGGENGRPIFCQFL